MSSEQATPAAVPVRADLTGRDPHRTLAGLIDVLDRADGGLVGQRSRPRRAAAYRAPHRPGPVRTVPLRSVPPAPVARRLPEATPVVTVSGPPQPEPTGGRRGLLRRVALWGAGSRGEYLAWPAPAPRPAHRAGSRAGRRLSALIRRAAFWGAGARGEYLAWSSGPARPAAPFTRAATDHPVVLRELPSTPTVAPVASSPAPALVPAALASFPRPRDPAAAPAAASSRRDPVRTRGDPWTWPARGSPTARAPTPPPRPAPSAPG